MRYLILVGLLSVQLRAADWYVDADVVSDGDGLAWATAWQQLTDIVWASVAAGDTIWISGGAYSGTITIGKSGTEGSPIRLKKSQEVGHNDLATLSGRISCSRNWITFDGAKDDSYTNSVTYTFQVTNVTNNIGWKIDSESTEITAINLTGSGPIGVRILWLEMTTGAGLAAVDKHCVRINAGDIDQCEVAYSYMHDTSADGVQCTQDTDWSAGSIEIHHNLIERIGDDGIVHNGGATIHHNIIRDTLEVSGHPDGIVGMGHNTYIYNNIIYDWNTQPMYPSIRQQEQTNFFVYGNVIYSDDLEESQEACIMLTVDSSFPWKTIVGSETNYVTNGIWGNVIIANNSFIAGRYVQNPLNIPNRYSPNDHVNLSAYVPGIDRPLIVALTNWVVKNNIFYGGNSFAANFKGSWGSGMQYAEADFDLEDNVFYSSITDGLRVMYAQSNYYANAEAMDAASAATGNTSAQPTFQDFEGRDFRLSTADTVARGSGQNLAALSLPGIEYDVYGNYRGAGAWDIGAIAISEVENTLLLHLDFEDAFPTLGYSEDISGSGAPMLRFGWAGDMTTNFPTITTGRVGSQAAAFVPYYDSHPYTDPDFNDGQYGAITNAIGMTNLTNATFTAWVKFAPISVSSPDDRTKNHNATILNSGYSTQGSWHWGRYYSTTFGQPQFNIQTNAAGGADATWRNTWPTISDGFWYTNAVWKHLAATVACGDGTNLTVLLYTNGVLSVSNYLALATSNAVPALRIHDPTGASTPPWIAVGCWTHNGPHYLQTNTVPNNGWLNGSLDDVRVYSSVLAASEIAEIFAEAGSEQGEARATSITIPSSRGKGKRPK